MISSINFGSSDKKHIRKNDPDLELGFVRDTTEFYRKDLERNNPLKKFPILGFDILEEKIEMLKNGYIGFKGDKNWGEFSDEAKIRQVVGDNILQKNLVKSPTYEIGGKVLNSFGQVYKMTKHMTDDITFKVANVLEITKQKFEKPCVFMFRNAWPYLKSEKRQELIANLEQNLPPQSLLVIGGYDNLSFIHNFLNPKKFSSLTGFLDLAPKIFIKK